MPSGENLKPAAQRIPEFFGPVRHDSHAALTVKNDADGLHVCCSGALSAGEFLYFHARARMLHDFEKRHQTDSIAKYAQLYCMANDSSIALKDRDIVAQMAANYNYGRYQLKALENEKKFYQTLLILIGFIVCFIFVILYMCELLYCLYGMYIFGTLLFVLFDSQC